MVLIISTFGPMNQYRDKEMMKKTLNGFLRSLDRQTSNDFRCFIACHNIPDWVPEYPWLEWCSVMIDKECSLTSEWVELPKDAIDPGKQEIKPFDCPMTDMSRKTYHAAICAGRWAYRQGFRSAWMLRVDSDDLLAKDLVEQILEADRSGYEAIFSRLAYMVDMQSGEVGIHKYPYSLTVNAIKIILDGPKIDRWFYLCRDHTKFASDVARDHIRALELPWLLCIATNSGNHISGRPRIEDHPHTKKIILRNYLVDLYGLDWLMEM